MPSALRGWRRWTATALAVAAVSTAGCSNKTEASSRTPPPATPTPGARPVVTRPGQGFPRGCSVGGVARRFVSLFDSLNTADVEGMREAFAPRSSFHWLTLGGEGEEFFRVKSPGASLDTFVRERHSQHETMTLSRIDVGYDPKRQIVNFTLILRRTADDVDPGWRVGKGGSACPGGRIDTLSISGAVPEDDLPPLCPGDEPEDARPLACARD